MKTVIVPVDETEESERAVPVGSALAERTGADVVLVMVNSPNVRPGRDEAYLESVLATLPASVHGRRLLALVDDPVEDVIVEEAVSSPDSVVVMSTHARSDLASLLVGSVADAVLRRSPVPVVLVGRRASTAAAFSRPVVVAVDGTTLDDDVVAAATSWSRATGAPLHAVHCRVPRAMEGSSC